MMSSLKLRLAACLLAGQILIYLASYIALPVFGVLDLFGVRSFFPLTYTEAAWQGVRDLVRDSLRRAPDGSLLIQHSAALRARLTRNPQLAYAAVDRKTRAFAQGSSPSLVAEISALEQRAGPLAYAGSEAGFRSGNGKDAFKIGIADSPLGEAIFAAKGFEFEWLDFWHVIRFSMRAAILYSPPILLVSAIIYG